MKVLVWTTVTYGAEGWTLKSEVRKKIQAAEMWFHFRLLNVTHKDRKTNVSILKDLNTERELFGLVVKRKLSHFGHLSRKKNLYIDNVKQWTGLTAHAAFQAALGRENWRNVTRKAVRAANALMDDAG